MKTPSSPQPRSWRTLGTVGWFALFATTFPPVGSLLLLGLITTHAADLRHFINTNLALGLLLYIAGFTLLAGPALLTTTVLAIVGGWAFGAPLGIPAACAGYMGAALLGYALVAPVAGTRVVDVINDRPRLRAVYDALLAASPVRSIAIIALLRLPPYFPFAPLNVIFAATRTRLPVYLAGSFLGMAPRTIALAFAAASVSELTFNRTEDTPMLIAGLIATAIAMLVITIVSLKAIRKVVPAPVRA